MTEPPEPSRGSLFADAVRQVAKLVGVLIVLNEVFVENQIRREAIAAAALLIMGTEGAVAAISAIMSGAKK